MIDSEPRQRVDKRLMVVDTDAEDLLSGNGEKTDVNYANQHKILAKKRHCWRKNIL